MSKNNVLLITAPPRDQMTPDLCPALGMESGSVPPNLVSFRQSVPEI